MFSFEQSSTSPFGQNNSSNNPFSPKPFGSQTDSSISGGTSTGVFGAAHTPSPFGASCSPAFGSSMRRSSSTPAFGSSSTSFEGSSGFGQKPDFGGVGIPTSIPKQVEAVRKQLVLQEGWKQQLEAIQKQLEEGRIRKQQLEAVGATRTSASRRMSSMSDSFGCISYDVLRFTYPTITEEDGGTSGQTAKLESISAMPAYKYERYESCFAIAGADYCVIAADFTRDRTKISKLSEKSVMVSFGLADGKVLQEALSAENLIYERQHNKPMSCPETLRLFWHFRKCHPDYFFIVLGCLDSEGKGCIFTDFGRRAVVYYGHRAVASPVGYSSQDSGSRPILPPIYNYKLPAKDVVARLSETEAVGLAKTVFESATHTGDKLEIVVLNASGLRRECADLRKDCDRSYGQVFSKKRKRNNSAVAESSSV